MSSTALGPLYPARRLGIDPRAYDPDRFSPQEMGKLTEYWTDAIEGSTGYYSVAVEQSMFAAAMRAARADVALAIAEGLCADVEAGRPLATVKKLRRAFGRVAFVLRDLEPFAGEGASRWKTGPRVPWAGDPEHWVAPEDAARLAVQGPARAPGTPEQLDVPRPLLTWSELLAALAVVLAYTEAFPDHGALGRDAAAHSKRVPLAYSVLGLEAAECERLRDAARVAQGATGSALCAGHKTERQHALACLVQACHGMPEMRDPNDDARGWLVLRRDAAREKRDRNAAELDDLDEDGFVRTKKGDPNDPNPWG